MQNEKKSIKNKEHPRQSTCLQQMHEWLLQCVLIIMIVFFLNFFLTCIRDKFHLFVNSTFYKFHQSAHLEFCTSFL